MEIEKLYKLFIKSRGVCTDTRMVQRGQLFFALKGDNFNGNNFAKQAVENGASYAIIDEPIAGGESFIFVENVLETLQQLAKYHRQQMTIPVIALTGSNGKTTTKELLAAILEKKYKAHYTKGNLNNHIGIPLTLLEMPMDTEIAVIEMGANHQREIASYCDYVLPDFGLITNIGKAHLEGFGGIEGVLKGKTELYQYIGENRGKLFVSDQSEKLCIKAAEYVNKEDLIYYGVQPSSFTQGYLIPSHGSLSFVWNGLQIETQLVGDYNFENALSAICIGQYFGVEPLQIKEALETYMPTNNRSQLVSFRSNTFVLDAYNANPSSLSAALQNFDKMDAKEKVTIIGAMMELGEYSHEEHSKIVAQINQMSLSERIYIGEGFRFLSGEDNSRFFATTAELKEWFDKQAWQGKTILLKGSRKNGLEKLLKE